MSLLYHQTVQEGRVVVVDEDCKLSVNLVSYTEIKKKKKDRHQLCVNFASFRDFVLVEQLNIFIGV